MACACNVKSIQPNNIDIEEETIFVEEKLEITNNIFSEIPLIDLPFTMFCGVDSYMRLSEFQSDSLRNIVPNPKQMGGDIGIIGKLRPIGNYEYVLYGYPGDIIYPYLYVYDNKLNVVDSLYLHIGYCGGDDTKIVSNTTVINKDYSIEMSEILKYIHYEETYDDVEDYIEDSVQILTKTYKLNTKHVFVATDSNCVKK
jgi:hypothetical protein